MFKPVLNSTIRGLAIACMTTVAAPTAWSEGPSRLNSEMVAHVGIPCAPDFRAKCNRL